MNVTLKSVLHEIAEHLDLSADHLAQLHEDIELHDDPAAQAEKAKGADDERAAKVAELKAQLAALEPAQGA